MVVLWVQISCMAMKCVSKCKEKNNTFLQLLDCKLAFYVISVFLFCVT